MLAPIQTQPLCSGTPCQTSQAPPISAIATSTNSKIDLSAVMGAISSSGRRAGVAAGVSRGLAALGAGLFASRPPPPRHRGRVQSKVSTIFRDSDKGGRMLIGTMTPQTPSGSVPLLRSGWKTTPYHPRRAREIARPFQRAPSASDLAEHAMPHREQGLHWHGALFRGGRCW